MIRDDALAKLISVRHFCFMRGVLGRKQDADFRQAFRTMNRLYVEARAEVGPTVALKGPRSVSKRLVARPTVAA